MTTPLELRQLAEEIDRGCHPANVAAILREYADRDEPTPAGLPLLAVQRLTQERTEREARRRMLDMALDTLCYIPVEQIVVENNPLWVGDGYNNGYSYLEQAQVLMPEVGPGEAEAVRNALAMLVQVANHRRRDELTDSQRVAIGWAETAVAA